MVDLFYHTELVLLSLFLGQCTWGRFAFFCRTEDQVEFKGLHVFHSFIYVMTDHAT